MTPCFASVQIRRKTRGFTLVELMVVVAIIGVLLAIALPGYREYVVRAKRDAAKAVLLEIVSRQEQYAGVNRAYATAIGSGSGELSMTIPDDVSASYTIAITPTSWTYTATGVSTTMSGFTASATPVAGSTQANDGTLSINQLGLKTRTVGGTTTTW